jgi:hypothetical protein
VAEEPLFSADMGGGLEGPARCRHTDDDRALDRSPPGGHIKTKMDLLKAMQLLPTFGRTFFHPEESQVNTGLFGGGTLRGAAAEA